MSYAVQKVTVTYQKVTVTLFHFIILPLRVELARSLGDAPGDATLQT